MDSALGEKRLTEAERRKASEDRNFLALSHNDLKHHKYYEAKYNILVYFNSSDYVTAIKNSSQKDSILDTPRANKLRDDVSKLIK